MSDDVGTPDYADAIVYCLDCGTALTFEEIDRGAVQCFGCRMTELDEIEGSPEDDWL
jgi:hypothetical protein